MNRLIIPTLNAGQFVQNNYVKGSIRTLIANTSRTGADRQRLPKSQNDLPQTLANLPFWADCDPSGQFLFVGNGNSAGHVGSVAATWNDVSAFTIGATGAPPGQLSPSGQGAQFPRSVPILYEHDTIAIVEWDVLCYSLFILIKQRPTVAPERMRSMAVLMSPIA